MVKFISGAWVVAAIGLLIWFFGKLPNPPEDLVHCAAYVTACTLLLFSVIGALFAAALSEP